MFMDKNYLDKFYFNVLSVLSVNDIMAAFGTLLGIAETINQTQVLDWLPFL